jgi:abortive infection bacteriophage resistance protein
MPTYTKPATDYSGQIAILARRGLVVPDPAFAAHCLAHHNYYRLSAYRFPLTVPNDPDQFLPGTTFEQLWALYDFDRQLRLLVHEACKRVEISVRSHWAYQVGHRHGSQAYENPSLFTDAVTHTQTLAKLDQELARSSEDFVAHFRTTYGTQRPPIWAVCEVMSFGQASLLYKMLAEPSLRQAIANAYQLDEKALGSFLHHLNLVRNICAHHARIWNRRFKISLQPPISKPAHLIPSLDAVPTGVPHPMAPNKIYNTLVLLAHMMDIIQPVLNWRHRLRAHILTEAFPVASHMGFPSDWLTRPIWLP